VPITPADIDAKEFRVTLRGYAVEEVDSFLDEVEAELARLLALPEETGSPAGPRGELPGSAAAEPGSWPAPTGEVGSRPADPADEGTDGQVAHRAVRVLRLAEQTADQLITDAKAEAEELLARARVGAEDVAVSTRASAARLELELAQRREVELVGLERRRSELEAGLRELEVAEREHRERMRALLKEQLRLLDFTGADVGEEIAA
jgi:DivIVA domain-containing protein